MGDTPCTDADILSYLQVNGMLGVVAATIIFTVTCCAYAPIFVTTEAAPPAWRGTVFNLFCIICFYAAHLMLIIYGTLATWSSNCRNEVPDLFDASRKYSVAAWILFLGGPLFLGFCYCLGAAIDILSEENDRYKKMGKKLRSQMQQDTMSDTASLLNSAYSGDRA